MSIQVTQHYQLVGTASAKTVGQTIISPRRDIWVALAISGEQAMDKINQVSQKIQSASVQSPASFYAFLQRILEMLSEYDVELSIAWISGSRVVLGAWNADVILRRSGKVGRVIQAGQEIKMIEGEVKESDMYMCLTRSGSSVLLPHFIQSFPSDFERELPKYVGMIQESGLGDRTAGVFFTVTEKDEVSQSRVVQDDTSSKKIPASLGKNITRVGGHVASLLIRWFHTQFRSHPRFRYTVFVVFFFVVIGILSIGGMRIFQANQDAIVRSFLAPFQEQFTQIRALEQNDQLTARDQANSLLIELQSQRQQYTQQRVTAQIDQFEASLREYYKSVSGKIELTTLPIFYDFRLIQSDFINTSADIDGAFAVFADREKKTVIFVNLDTKEQKQLPLGEYPEIRDIAFDQEKVWILGDGVYEYTLESDRLPEKVISSDDQLAVASEIGVFDGAVYAFSPDERNIFRYSKDEEGKYGEAVGWIQQKQGIDFTISASLTIDGAIWISFQDGKILKMERGNQTPFEITGIQTPISTSVYLFTKPDYENIYILEPVAERVVVVKKDGTFIKEVNSPSLVTATQLIVREETKKGYVLAGSVVYEVGL